MVSRFECESTRELLRRGYSTDSLLTLRGADEHDDRFAPVAIGELARWSVSDSDRGGLKRIRWQRMPEDLKRRGG